MTWSVRLVAAAAGAAAAAAAGGGAATAAVSSRTTPFYTCVTHGRLPSAAGILVWKYSIYSRCAYTTIG